MAINLKPNLPASLPHRHLINVAFQVVASSDTAAAYRAGLVGSDVVMFALKAMIYDLIIAQDEGGSARAIADAMHEALVLAQQA